MTTFGSIIIWYIRMSALLLLSSLKYGCVVMFYLLDLTELLIHVCLPFVISSSDLDIFCNNVFIQIVVYTYN